MKKLLVFLFCFITFSSVIMAQTDDYKTSIGLFGGKNEYNGDLGNGILNFDKAFYGFGALQVNRYLSPSFDLGLMAGYGHYGFYKESGVQFRGEKLDPTLLLT